MALRLPCASRELPIPCRTFKISRRQIAGSPSSHRIPSLAPRPMPIRGLNQFSRMIEGASGSLLRPLAGRLWTTGQAAHAVEAPSAPSTALHTLEVGGSNHFELMFKMISSCNLLRCSGQSAGNRSRTACVVRYNNLCGCKK